MPRHANNTASMDGNVVGTHMFIMKTNEHIRFKYSDLHNFVKTSFFKFVTIYMTVLSLT